MVSHVRVRLVNGLCHGFTDGNGLRLCEGLIDDGSCPREGETKLVGKGTQSPVGELRYGAGELRYGAGELNYEAPYSNYGAGKLNYEAQKLNQHDREV
jgi:hypothetical protein